MQIALDAAKGLEYLHEHVSPPVIHRDFKSSNILLDDNFHAKVSDFGLAKFGSDKAGGHVSTRILGTQGYVAPEYNPSLSPHSHNNYLKNFAMSRVFNTFID